MPSSVEKSEIGREQPKYHRFVKSKSPRKVFQPLWQIWKANRRNYRISIREKQQPRAKTRRDWVFLAVIMVVALAVVAIPISILIWLVRTRLR
jgi:hypothetical protein